MSINEKIEYIDALIALTGEKVSLYSIWTTQYELSLVLSRHRLARPEKLDRQIQLLEKQCYGF